MNKLDVTYQNLLKDILENGVEKGDRTGTGTLSVFGKQITHNMSDGFPLLTTKKVAIKTMMTELKWFLKGDTNIKYLIDNGCNIWNGDVYKSYRTKMQSQYESGGDVASQHEFIELIREDDEFAAKWGELGPIYGKQWRNWETEIEYDTHPDYKEATGMSSIRNTEYIDQIQNLINELKTNPDSRRLLVSAWNVGELEGMTLPPCHYGFQVYTRETTREEKITNPGKYRAISLMWNQRSVDTFLGLPFNIASYGMLLTLLAEEVDMVPDMLIGSLGDTHLYSNHVEQAQEQIDRTPFTILPQIKLGKTDILNGEFDYEISHYNSHPTIKAPLSN
jgi:thymidylate synthase